MIVLRSQNKITDFLMILSWASPFNAEPTLQSTLKQYWGDASLERVDFQW